MGAQSLPRPSTLSKRFLLQIAGKWQPALYIRINNDVRSDFNWALSTLEHLPPIRLLHSSTWNRKDASMTVYCDACPKGMGFWFPKTNVAYYSDVPPQTPALIYYVEALCVLSAIEHWALLQKHVAASTSPHLYRQHECCWHLLFLMLPTRVQHHSQKSSNHVCRRSGGHPCPPCPRRPQHRCRCHFARSFWLSGIIPPLAIHDLKPPHTITKPPSFHAGGNQKMNLNLPTGRKPLRAPWTMDRLLRERAIALGNIIEPSTLRTYNSALTSYLTFVRAHNLFTTPTEDTLSFYIVYMSHHISPCSVTTYLSGIVQQLEPFYPLIRDLYNSKLVQRTLQGCLKTCAQPTSAL